MVKNEQNYYSRNGKNLPIFTVRTGLARDLTL